MNKFKKLVILTIFVFTSIVASANTINQIKSNGILRVGTTGDYSPFSLLKDGEYNGYDIEVAKYFAKQLGVRIRFIPTTWKTLLSDLNSNKFDIAMGGMSQTLDRKLVSELTIPYLTYGKTPIVRSEDKNKYKTLADIDKKGVVVGYNVGGTNEQYALKNIKKATLVEFEENLDVIQAVRVHNIDVMIAETPEAVHYENIDKALASSMTNTPLTKSHLGYMVAKGNIKLVSIIDKMMEDMRAKGIEASMQKKLIK